jgi:hypothetical protein
MNLLEMVNRVYRMMRDPLQTKYDPSFIRQYINEGVKIYCKQTEYSVESDQSITLVDGQKEYALPADNKHVKKVYYGTNRLYPISFEHTIVDPENGIPTNFYLRNNNIGIYPTPLSATDTLTVIYVSTGPVMSLDTDETVVPEEHTLVPIMWACYQCAIEGDDSRATEFYRQYVEHLQLAQRDVIEKEYRRYPNVGDRKRIELDDINHDVGGLNVE